MRILMTGATGYIGSRLVGELLEAGHQVVVTSRKPERLRDYGWFDEVSIVQLDAREKDSATKAFSDAGQIDTVYYLVHGIGDPGFREVDNRAAANVAKAAKAAGVGRIVYLGGFVPGDEELSDHLAGRAEVAEALTEPGGAELVWLGAALIFGAGSTSFEILRYVGDRFPVLPIPSWMHNPIDPISIRDVLHYLVAAADPERVPAGSYDIYGPERTTYRDLLASYARLAGNIRVEIPVGPVPTVLASKVSALALPVPGSLTADLTASLDYPMVATDAGLRERVSDPDGGLLGVDESIRRSLTRHRRRPVNDLADPHHLADTDPDWAGGDSARIRELTPSIVRPALGVLAPLPGPARATVRTGLDVLAEIAAKVDPR
ncbi:NAD(P)H-binding protein [Mycolicibacterium neoaurum]|uniref:NAD(P)H-binding protein n=1 Tax=Mycolicibacterium TaxID=1866885 RepID=UPI001BCFF039|nr:NAD(P)H-binding protein [Mycolicibacterium neoaurum]QVI29603.1 NAD(P)H-binding protein [Mycolicibacterium neoaurum]